MSGGPFLRSKIFLSKIITRLSFLELEEKSSAFWRKWSNRTFRAAFYVSRGAPWPKKCSLEKTNKFNNFHFQRNCFLLWRKKTTRLSIFHSGCFGQRFQKKHLISLTFPESGLAIPTRLRETFVRVENFAINMARRLFPFEVLSDKL